MSRVLLDVDGVLVDFVAAYVAIARQVTRKPFKAEDVKEWDCGVALGLKPEELASVHEYLFAPGFASRLKLYAGALEAVHGLMRSHDVWFVTTPLNENPTWVFDRRRWFQWHFGQAAADRVVHVKDKRLVGGDVFVDDKPGNVESWCASHPTGIGFLWQREYNLRHVKLLTELYEGPHHLPANKGEWHQVQKLGPNAYATSDWKVVQHTADNIGHSSRFR